jgi:hypothetical protein
MNQWQDSYFNEKTRVCDKIPLIDVKYLEIPRSFFGTVQMDKIKAMFRRAHLR